MIRRLDLVLVLLELGPDEEDDEVKPGGISGFGADFLSSLDTS